MGPAKKFWAARLIFSDGFFSMLGWIVGGFFVLVFVGAILDAIADWWKALLPSAQASLTLIGIALGVLVGFWFILYLTVRIIRAAWRH